MGKGAGANPLQAIRNSGAGRLRSGIRLYLQIDTGDLSAAIWLETVRALAELRELRMSASPQLHSRRGQETVDIYTCIAFELEKYVHYAALVGTAKQQPATSAENCAREGLHQKLRLFRADGLHLHRPTGTCLLPHIAVVHGFPRNQTIGAGRRIVYANPP